MPGDRLVRDQSQPRRPRRTVADLPRPFYAAHRGMAAIYPENTLEAYRASLASGVDVVEEDCWLTRDAELICLHDGTVDRTTTGTGNTHDLAMADVAALRVDAGEWFAPAWPDSLRVPSFSDALGELGGRTVLCPEAKNSGAGAAIATALERRGLVDTAIVQSFIRSELDPVVAAGGHAMLLSATSSYDPAAVRAAGIRYLGLSAALPADLVAPASAAGLDVAVWVLDRRVDLTRWLAAGVAGFFSDDPLYVSGRSPVSRSDPFRLRTFGHGHLASAVAGDRGTFWPGGAWGYAGTGEEYRGALQGWAGRLTDDRFGITLTIRIDAAADADGWAGVFVCAADDRSFDDLDRHRPGLCGYHVMLHQSGELEVRIVDDGISRRVACAASPALPPGGTATIRVQVAPAELAVTRLDTADPPAAVTVADGTHRGGYLHLGRRRAAVRFSDLGIDQEAPHAHHRR